MLALCFKPAIGFARQTVPQPAQTINQLSTILSASDPTVFASQKVELRDVPIGRVLNGRVILIGTNMSHQLLLRLPEPMPKLRPGQRIDVSGTLDQMPVRLNAWNPNEAWNLDPATRNLIRNQRVFLNARRVLSHPETEAK